MRILITGNMGYVGAVLTRYVRRTLKNVEIIGFDTAYFGHSLTGAGLLPEALLDRQVFGDVREFPSELLDGVDSVVHLAAVSNDPMGNKFEAVTGEINRDASARIALLAAERGVANFVFASSCSMYGYAERGARKESDPTNPLTAYARSKIGSENAFAKLDLAGMVVTSLRFATACGMSDRLRLDLVLNDFVACAMASGEITVLSDGTPWRRSSMSKTWRARFCGRLFANKRTAAKYFRLTPAATRAIIRSATWRRPSRAKCRAPRSLLTRERRRTIAPIGWTFPCSTRSRRTIFRKCRSNSRSPVYVTG